MRKLALVAPQIDPVPARMALGLSVKPAAARMDSQEGDGRLIEVEALSAQAAAKLTAEEQALGHTSWLGVLQLAVGYKAMVPWQSSAEGWTVQRADHSAEAMAHTR